MTTTQTMPPADASAATVFRRAAAAEWTRVWTIRSTWWCLAAATGLMVFIGGAAGSDHTGPDPAPIWIAAQFAIAPAQFAFLLLVLLAVTGEYSTGAIRSSLQWVPRRGVLFAARILVPVAFATACAVLAAAASDLVAWSFLGSAAEVVGGDIAASLGRIALVVAFGSVLAVGLGLLLRSTAGTLTAMFLLILALPIALGNTGVRALVAISDHLPGRAIVSLLVVDEVELAPSAIARVMIAWALAAVVAGGWSLLRRDAT
jgi:ABC-2 type transport system permease protein